LLEAPSSLLAQDLLLGTFFDGELTTVVAALGAYMVVHNLGSAVAASGQLRFLQRIMRSSLSRTGLRESVFWMWHITIFFVYLFQLPQSFPSRVGIVGLALRLVAGDILRHLWVAVSFRVHVLQGYPHGHVFV